MYGGVTEVELNHSQIVQECLAGVREADEQTLTSVAILAERLERLKRFSSSFSEVSFSAAVKKLTRHKNTAIAAV
jgi:hypothetical protein